MANMRDIKQRINATKKTAQITKAMHMVSASKLKKAEKAIKQYRPLTEKLESILTHIFNEDHELSHPMLEERNIKHTTFVLITSDRGLAGPYNANVFKNFEKHITQKGLNPSDFSIAALGFKAMSYAKNNGYNLVNEAVIQIRDDVQFIDFQKISDRFIKDYLSGKTDQIVVVFNKFINTITQDLTVKTLVPLSLNPDVDIQKVEGLNPIYDFEPSVKATLDTLLPNYVVNMLYGMILEAKASEHAARMTAMKNATDNANDVIHDLTLSFNKARQDAITIELTDIIGGANAVS
jgi:F-type H+-transporting ATPase subunit gamma